MIQQILQIIITALVGLLLGVAWNFLPDIGQGFLFGLLIWFGPVGETINDFIQRVFSVGNSEND